MTTETLQFVHITDPHLFGDPDRRLRGIPTYATLRAVLAEAAPEIARATAVLATGDLVQDDPDGYARFRELLAPAGRPVLCIPGNHDDADALRSALSTAPFQSSGHADFGAWRIILLDSSVAGRAGGRLGEERMEALRRTLAAPGPPHVLVAIHHHPCRMDSAWLDSVGLEDEGELFAVLAQDPRVRAIVFGHVHQAFDGQRDGIRLLGTPSTCAQFLPKSDDFVMDTRPPAWRTLALGADGRIATQLGWLPSERLLALQADTPAPAAAPALPHG